MYLYKSIQKHVLTSQGKDANKEYKRGYYCTNICDWKYTNLITKKGKFYRLTSLGKLYLTNPQKANDKIKINKLKARVDRLSRYWQNIGLMNQRKIIVIQILKSKGLNFSQLMK